MSNRTLEIVRRQALVMDAKFFEIGLVKPATKPGSYPVMLTQTWNLDELLGSIPWLKSQNADDRNIYVRPTGKHSLTLLDDLSADALEHMRHSGFTPAAIVETSPDNFQAWLHHGRSLLNECRQLLPMLLRRNSMLIQASRTRSVLADWSVSKIDRRGTANPGATIRWFAWYTRPVRSMKRLTNSSQT